MPRTDSRDRLRRSRARKLAYVHPHTTIPAATMPTVGSHSSTNDDHTQIAIKPSLPPSRRPPAGRSFWRAWQPSSRGGNCWPSANPSIRKANAGVRPSAGADVARLFSCAMVWAGRRSPRRCPLRQSGVARFLRAVISPPRACVDFW